MAKFPSYHKNYVEIPSMDQVEAMDRQRQEAIESLEISNGLVKCQGLLRYILPHDQTFLENLGHTYWN
jgi:hypothetical protein